MKLGWLPENPVKQREAPSVNKIRNQNKTESKGDIRWHAVKCMFHIHRKSILELALYASVFDFNSQLYPAWLS